METAAQSNDSDVAEELLRFFVDASERECFAAMLYTCYDLIRADLVLEVAWMHGLLDYAFPYLIQTAKEYSGVPLALADVFIAVMGCHLNWADLVLEVAWLHAFLRCVFECLPQTAKENAARNG